MINPIIIFAFNLKLPFNNLLRTYRARLYKLLYWYHLQIFLSIRYFYNQFTALFWISLGNTAELSFAHWTLILALGCPAIDALETKLMFTSFDVSTVADSQNFVANAARLLNFVLFSISTFNWDRPCIFQFNSCLFVYIYDFSVFFI
jgi:hypothetical protein